MEREVHNGEPNEGSTSRPNTPFGGETTGGGRKPPGVSWESWVERQIREGIDQGAFDKLEGAGKPIAGLDEPHDEEWWVKEKLRREEVAFLPPTLRIKKELQDAKAQIAATDDEAEVRRLIADINARIREVNSKQTFGPPSTTMTLNVEETVARWRSRD